MTPQAEFAAKLDRLRAHLDRRGAAVALIASRAGFSWLTAGGHNHVNHAQEPGVGVFAVTRSGVSLLCSNIEAPRLGDEEIAVAGVEVVAFPWHDPSARTAAFARATAAGPAILDVPLPGVAAEWDRGLHALRTPLLGVEQDRYREAGRRAGRAIAEAAAAVAPGMTEMQAAAEIHSAALRAGLLPWVTLVAADGRIARYRHPVAQERVRIAGRVMLVCCAEHRGLITAVTRLVSFGPLDDETRRRHDAVVRVDAALIAGTRPGRTLGDILADGVAAYAAAGFPDEWRHHHQGGPCGYAPRDAIAVPGAADTASAGQAFAWNPSVAGTKSEDTVLLTDAGPEVISASPGWPMIPVESGGVRLERPDWLIR